MSDGFNGLTDKELTQLKNGLLSIFEDTTKMQNYFVGLSNTSDSYTKQRNECGMIAAEVGKTLVKLHKFSQQ